MYILGRMSYLTIIMSKYNDFFICVLVIGWMQADAEICLEPICEYNFIVRHSRTMMYWHTERDVYNVKLDGDKLKLAPSLYRPEGSTDVIGKVVNANDVITADGYVRDIITINGQFPGPTIEVAEGSQVSLSDQIHGFSG